MTMFAVHLPNLDMEDRSNLKLQMDNKNSKKTTRKTAK